jgi:hypothetical protein
MRSHHAVGALVLLAVLGLPARSAEPSAVVITVNKDQIDFRAGNDQIGSYRTSASLPKPHFNTLNGPGGVSLTRPWPIDRSKPGATTDHPHHKPATFCHGDVIPEGLEIKNRRRGIEGADFWSETANTGKIVCVQVDEPKQDRNHGSVKTHNEWRTADGTKVLEDATTLHLYDFGDRRLLVFDIDLHASVCPITFGDTKEGSFQVRVSDAIRERLKEEQKVPPGPGKIENAEGKVSEDECWGYVSAWCDYSGPIQGRTVGVAVFADPNNRTPSCWMSRGYGLLAANPFGRDKAGFPAQKGKTDVVKLARGEHLRLRYGILLHPGDAKGGKVADYFQRFVQLRE